MSKQYDSVFTDEATSPPEDDKPLFPPMPNITITAEGIRKQLQNLNPSKAIGPDEIPTRILKEQAEIITPILTEIYQQSLDSSEVPTDWKQAKIAAVYKKGSKSVASNYRPVSLTCLLCKVLGHVIFSNNMQHSDRHNFLMHFQHAFRKALSCETQLITTIDDLANSLDKKQQVDCLLLDFRKDFDTVAHG